MRHAIWLALLGCMASGVRAEDQPAAATLKPHPTKVTFYLSEIEGEEDVAAINASVKKLPSVTAVDVTTEAEFALVAFDSHVVSFHQVAQAITDAGNVTGRTYDPRIVINIPEYAEKDNAAKVDAVFERKPLLERVLIEPLDKAKGQFTVRLQPLATDTRATGPQGFNGGHLGHPIRDEPPKGLGLKFSILREELPMQ